MSVLMIFVDGVGSALDRPELRAGALVVPTDATLGVDGLPQSASGQTTLLTGINAARQVGRHVHGFCTRALAGILDGTSLFARVRRGGGGGPLGHAHTPAVFRGGRRS